MQECSREDLNLAGHYVEDGNQYRRVMHKAGPSNFDMVPIGMICMAGSNAQVFETNDFVKQIPPC